jgi:hypothetical protein
LPIAVAASSDAGATGCAAGTPFLSELPSAASKDPSVECLRAGYDPSTISVDRRQQELSARYRAAQTDKERAAILKATRRFLVPTFRDRVLGVGRRKVKGPGKTPGKYTGTCGSFVVFTLQDAGFRIPPEMAALPFENIVKSLVGTTGFKRFGDNAPYQDVVAWLKRGDEGVFVFGVDGHLGYVTNWNNADPRVLGTLDAVWSEYEPPFIAQSGQDMGVKNPFSVASRRIAGKLFDDEMLKKWLLGETFPVVCD